MLRYLTLLSGSSGNAAFIENERDAVLLDGGLSFRTLSRLCAARGADLSKVRALLLTHEHADHSKGAGVIARKLGVPVHATRGTWTRVAPRAGRLEEDAVRLHRAGDDIELGGLRIETFPLSHDALEPCGYIVASDEQSVAFLTDSGCVPPAALPRLGACQGLVLEANHDPELLRTGRYPYPLKRRIASERGHLSNQDCLALARQVVGRHTRYLTLAHLSEENNRPELVRALLADGLRQFRNLSVSVAPRFEASEWMEL